MNLGDRELGIGEDKGTMRRRNDFGGKMVSYETLSTSFLVFIERGFDICVHQFSSINHHH